MREKVSKEIEEIENLKLIMMCDEHKLDQITFNTKCGAHNVKTQFNFFYLLFATHLEDRPGSHMHVVSYCDQKGMLEWDVREDLAIWAAKNLSLWQDKPENFKGSSSMSERTCKEYAKDTEYLRKVYKNLYYKEEEQNES